AEAIRQVGEALQRLGTNPLSTIGGDDTAYSASRLAKTVPGLTVAHVPKTIDNDLPLPGDIVTFGFTTACNLGKELVRNLMQDAQTTERWFFVTVMGRHAGHLALGIGGSAAATLTVIAEEFPEPRISLERVADTLEGAIIKRRVQGREHGVAILSEGLGEKLDLATLGDVERDAYGNVRLTELDIGHVLKDRVSASLKSRGVDVTITAKDLGYELRCSPPGAPERSARRGLRYTRPMPRCTRLEKSAYLLLILLAVVFMGAVTRDAWRMIGRPWTGFPVMENMLVGVGGTQRTAAEPFDLV